MTVTKQTPELQEKKTEQAVGSTDNALGSQAIIKQEDNRIFLQDKPLLNTAKTLDLATVDIYQAHPNSDHAYGPDRRPGTMAEKTQQEIKAAAEIRFDNLDKSGLSNADKLNFQTNDADLKKLLNNKVENTSADFKVEQLKNTPEKNEKPVVDEYVVKPGDSVERIAKHLAGKDGTAHDTQRIIKEIVGLNGWKDANHPMHPGDRVKVPGDKAADAKPEEQKQSEAKEKLVKQAEEKFKNDPEKLAQFKENMRLFEERAERDKLSPTEIAKTYKEIDRLLEAKGDKPLKPEQRKDLAEQIMRQAADPTSIAQGQHNTCNMATVETRMYTRNPSDAARLVADVALTGQYVASDGRRVHVNPGAHDEARNRNTTDGDRSHASEIFQVTAVNLHIDQENRKTNPHGQLRYEQHPTTPGSGDTGERIIDYATKPPTVKDNHPQIYDENLGNLRDTYSAITGKPEKGVVITHDGPNIDKSDGVTRVKSEQELNDALAQAKKDGKLPLIVTVDTSMEPFWTDSGSGAAGGSGGGHVVTITDYSPGPPAKVTVDNQWGSANDHDATKPISVHELYGAIKDKGHAVSELEKDVKAAKDAGQPDNYKELELARLKFQDAQLSKEDYEKEVTRLSKEAAKMPDGPEKERVSGKLKDTMNSLEPAAAMRVLREQHKDGLLNDVAYKAAVQHQVDIMIGLRDESKRLGVWNKVGKLIYDQGVAELMETIKGFTAEEIKAIRDSLKTKK
ncbi:hypothetical protein BH11CYA1_BH11CYA1_03350 [soil metagenome]